MDHVVLSGSCWEDRRRRAVRLDAGDLILFPHGDRM
jgi:hypothetical protein